MRTKILFSLAVAMLLPTCLTGCDSSETQVGTGEGTPPPHVVEQLKKEEEQRNAKMKEQEANPTPSPPSE